MGFFKDILSGGGALHKKIIPSELRGLAPKEIQPGGFDPAKQWLGYDINANPERDQMMKMQAEQDAANAHFQSLGQPSVGMAPPNQRIPGGGQALQPFMANGPYGAQALQLAGLLGGPGGGQDPGGPRPVGMTQPYRPGMFMPGFRPGVDQPIIGGGGASGPKRGRIWEY